MKEKKGQWYLLTGILIGFLAGLAVAWIIQPVEYTDTSPASLRPTYKDHYRVLIATAYIASGDLVRAKARLKLLGDENPPQALTEQAQRKLAEGSSPEEARALGLLASAMGQVPPGQPGAITPFPTPPEAPAPLTPAEDAAESSNPSQTTP
jgi:hypothetical protein